MKICFFLLSLLLLSSFAFSANYYVNAGSTCTSSCGSDWSNAFQSLGVAKTTQGNLLRGSIYYIAAGTYPGFVFDTPESGTQYITIKKANANDHGTSTGWQSSYASQAVFSSELKIKRGYYKIDGQSRNEGDWKDSASYGFKINISGGTEGRRVGLFFPGLAGGSSDLKRFIEVQYFAMGGPSISLNQTGDRGIDLSQGFASDLYFGKLLIYNTDYIAKGDGVSNVVIEKGYFGPGRGKEAIRGSGILNNWIVRNNKFVDNGIPGNSSLTADIAVWENGLQANNWEIYGNLFVDSRNYWIQHNNAIILGGASTTSETVSNWKVYNNVFAGMQGYQATVYLTGGANNYVYNNIWYDVGNYNQTNQYSAGVDCTATSCENNWCFKNNPLPSRSGFDCQKLKTKWPTTILGSSNPFVNSATLDFGLNSAASGLLPINFGKNLGAGFDSIDALGNVRGFDGSWDIGAFEFAGVSPPEDTTPPTTTASPSGGTYAGAQSIILSRNEAGTTYYCLVSGCTPSTVYSSAVAISSSGTLRYYSVDTAGNSETVKQQVYTISPQDIVAPSVPSGFFASAVSSSQIDLSWTASTDNVAVTGYKIFRSLTQAGTFVQVGSSTANSKPDSNGLSASTAYWYKVSAFDAAGNNSAQSSVVSATTQAFSDTQVPSVPSNLSAITASSSQITLSWSASTDNVGVAGYNIYSGGSKIATSTITSYQNTGLAASTIYNYKVSAFDAASNESAQSVQVLATTQEAAAVDIISGVAASYSFDEGSGTSFNDSSGNGNNGTINGAIWNSAGKYGKALSFDGVNDFADVANFNIAGDKLTLTAWVNYQGTGWQHIVSKLVQDGSHNSPYFAYSLHLNNDSVKKPRFWITSGASSASNLTGNSTLSANSWHYLAAVYDGASMKLYIDGVLAGSSAKTGSLASFNGSLRFGANGSGTEALNGLLDNVRIYSRALNLEEIQAVMQTPVGSQPIISCFDLTADSKVDVFDLVFVSLRIGNNAGDPADVKGNDGINIQDLQEVAMHFGQNC